MRRHDIIPFMRTFFAATLVIAGCGTSEEPLCQAGQVVTCSCPSGEVASQTCADDGASFSACGPCDYGTGGNGGNPPVPPGEPEWSHSFGALGIQRANALGLDQQGHVVMGGEISDTLSLGGDVFEAFGPNDAFVARYDDAGNHLQSALFGDQQDSYLAHLAVDGSGGCLFVGHYNGVMNFGGGNLESNGHVDMYIAKLDAQGAHQWSQNYGSLYFDQATAIAVDSQGAAYVTGFFMDSVDFGISTLSSEDDLDAFVLKLSPQGTPDWIVQISGPGDQQGFAITATDDAVWVGSGFDQTLTLANDTRQPSDGFDIFIAKLSTSDGSLLASQVFGGSGKQQVNSMVTTESGEVLLTGFSEKSRETSAVLVAKLDSDASISWTMELTGSAGTEGSSIATNASAFGVAGTFAGTLSAAPQTLESAGEEDAFVAMFSEDGNLLWARAFGGAESDHGSALTIANDARLTLAGRFEGEIQLATTHNALGESDAFLTRLSP